MSNAYTALHYMCFTVKKVKVGIWSAAHWHSTHLHHDGPSLWWVRTCYSGTLHCGSVFVTRLKTLAGLIHSKHFNLFFPKAYQGFKVSIIFYYKYKCNQCILFIILVIYPHIEYNNPLHWASLLTKRQKNNNLEQVITLVYACGALGSM